MTREELNRTMEFILQSQARLAAAQEQDREERIGFEKWSKNLTSQLTIANRRIVELIEIESSRLDRQDQALRQYEKEQRETHLETQKRHEQFILEMRSEMRSLREESRRDAAEAQKRHEEALARLDRILEKLTERMN